MVNYNENYNAKFAEMKEGMMAFVNEKLKGDEEKIGIMTTSAEKLKDAMPDPGLKEGSAAPDFTLKDTSGSEVTLSEELKEGPVVLVFYRGIWCPVCNMHLKALEAIVPTLKSDHKARIIAVTPQKPELTKKQLEDVAVSYTIYHDTDDSVAKAYGLYFEIDSELNTLYKELGLDVEATNGEGRLGLPIPATFVIAENGTVVAAQTDTNYLNRMKPDEIIAGLEAAVASAK